ncbi:MAG: radical SAM protein, partial [Chloroflexota bacterium]|nr:radical SAM protein [Chloroflexota bacterium]
MAWQETKHARERLAREQGTIIKDWGGRIAAALVYPNAYYLGMSNMGLQTLYRLLNSYDNIVCERVFWEGRAGRGGPISLESQRPLADFALLAFSVSYELDYFNVVQLLKAAAIPLRAEERDERHPILIAGGPVITANPMPLSPFFDALAIGEGEVILPPLVERLPQALEGTREEALATLAEVPGLYLPRGSNAQPVRRQWVRDLESIATTSVVLTPDTELGDMYLIEIERGCAQGCRFCLAGHLFRPQRHRSL